MTISLGGSLPQGDGNGLAAIVSDLIREPKKYHAVIGIVDTSKITTKPDSGEVVPTVRVRRIEGITQADLKMAGDLVRRALGKRTGKGTRPFRPEGGLEAGFPERETPALPGPGSGRRRRPARG